MNTTNTNDLLIAQHDIALLGLDEELGFGFLKKIGKGIGKAAKSVGKVAKSVIKSPITKVVAGGVAVVFPPVGISAMAAISVADKVVTAAEQTKDVAKKAAALRTIVSTKKAAKSGDVGAKRALLVMRKVKAAPPATRAKIKTPRFQVTSAGRIRRVA